MARRPDDAFDASRRAETLSSLAEPGCPSCRARSRQVTRWLEAFASEHHADVGVILLLRASRGFCAPHTRQLLASSTATSLLGTVYADVLPAAAAELATRPGAAAARCPACLQADDATDRAHAQLRADLADPAVRQAYRAHGGLCLPDALAIASAASGQTARFVLGVVQERFADSAAPLSDSALLETVAGRDDDAVQRDRLRLADRNTVVANYRLRVSWTNPRDRLVALLADDACPVCATAARQLWEQLEWLGAVAPADVRAEEVLLCPTHLHDVSSVDAAAGRRAAASTADAILGRIGRLLDRAAPARATDSWTKTDRAVGDSVVAAQAQASCRICATIVEGEQRGTTLLVAMLADPAVNAAFERGHGVCLRHAHGWADPATIPVVRDTTKRRIAEAAWELDEARRKTVWWNRYESRGAEVVAWRRAPEILDSWVYLGIGAPTQPTT
jgi:hypothetical protein